MRIQLIVFFLFFFVTITSFPNKNKLLSFSLYAYLQVQFRNNIFLVSSFFLHINVFKFANTFSQIFLWISYLVFFFLFFSSRIEFDRYQSFKQYATIRKKNIQDPADFHEKQNSSRCTVFTERSAVIMRVTVEIFQTEAQTAPEFDFILPGVR